MKKFLAAMVLAVTLVFIGSQNNQAEAYDYYVGTWKSGYDAYLMTETIGGSRVDDFTCTVKAVNGRSVMYINYSFYWDAYAHAWRFSNSDGVNNSVNNGTSIEKNIMSFVARN